MPHFYINMLKASSYKVTHCRVVADFAVSGRRFRNVSSGSVKWNGECESETDNKAVFE